MKAALFCDRSQMFLRVNFGKKGDLRALDSGSVKQSGYHPPLIFRAAKLILLLVLLVSAVVRPADAQNAIVTENALPGNPSSEWDISGAGDLTIQGFATDISVNKGQTVRFKIKTDANAYTINIYRLGYYQGNGARKVGAGVITATLPQIQPADLYDTATGKTDCGNWTESAHWDVPANAVSGIYIARLQRSNGGASHIIFIVRDDASSSDLVFKTSDGTWQAYNNYGGNSLYVNNSGIPVPGFNHATKVSYNRPFYTRNGGGGGLPSQDWVFNAEYPMLRWLEMNGYNVTYITTVDADRYGSLLTNHKVFMSVGHDEYWSGNQRSNVEAMRSAGKNLAFFSGNEIYWKTRWEDTYRTLVCYKEGTLGENSCGTKCDPFSTSVWTGLWRDGCGANYPPNDGCRPENSTSGQISWGSNTSSILVPAAYKNLRFWRNTSIASLAAGQTSTLPNGTLGYEWDAELSAYANSYPAGRITLSNTFFNNATHKISIYRTGNGAWVFGAGTVQWSWGLDGNHDRGTSVPSADMQQATVNLFADMAVQPGSLQPGLIPATQTTDTIPPVTVITSPANGTAVPANSTVTITGTATDNYAVGVVEVSVDGGLTWHPATGTNNWSYTWITGGSGTINVKTRGFDDSGNKEIISNSGNSITITVSSSVPVNCPCTIFQPSQTPATPLLNDQAAIVTGVKFKPTQNGYITGLRFYKASGDTGTHSGQLWTRSGTILANVSFTNESASGWQQVNLVSPVAVTSGTTYVASYFSSKGFYSSTDHFFDTAYLNVPLRGLAAGEDGPNGVYIYSSAPAFPNTAYLNTNFWVDVVFNTTAPKDSVLPAVASTAPVANSVNAGVNAPISITFNKEIDPSTVNTNSIFIQDASLNLIPCSVSYTPGYYTATLRPSAPLTYSNNYRVTVKGGNGYYRIKDLSGNALAADYIFNFSTTNPPPPPPDEGPGGPILVISSTYNPFSRYTAEMMKTLGFNEYKAMDISSVNASVLSNYDVVILGSIPLTAANVSDLTAWTNAGGTLIAFKPDVKLDSLLGINPVSGSLADGYVLVNTALRQGAGIVNQTIQFHASANLYTLGGATSLAALYSNAFTATGNPAVTVKRVGNAGGSAVAFAYDLPKSVVYSRQGDPGLSGVKRDGTTGPIRSDDMYYPSWIDMTKVAIPQADEQLHLLSNIIIRGNLNRKPLPRMWFLPKGLKAAVIMTGDDHAVGKTVDRFNQYISLSPDNSPNAVADWNAIRASSYIYPGTPITDSQLVVFQKAGFEIGLHLYTGCADFTPSSWLSDWNSSYASLQSQLPSMLPQKSHRTHCVAWSDYSSQAKNELSKGVRLDVNYYYYPAALVNDKPGLFTGSGMPMRFADVDGTTIDCYQVPTQLTDESGQTISTHINTLLDNATGAPGYYGVFCANMHTDNGFPTSQSGSDAIVSSAQAHSVPVVSSKQMLDWLDGRNGSSFNNISWNNNKLTFTITAATGSRNMKAMVPMNSLTGTLTSLNYNGAPLAIASQTIKGLPYAFFDATLGNGTYTATYSADSSAPVISNIVAVPHGDGTATITWTTNKPTDSKVNYDSVTSPITMSMYDASLVTSHSVTLNNLQLSKTYYFRITSTDIIGNTSTNPGAQAAPLSFTMPAPPCAIDLNSGNFLQGTTDTGTVVTLQGNGNLILKPRLNDEFSGTTLQTANWTPALYNSNGSVTLNNGLVTVSGSHIYSNLTFGPGSSLEFLATFRLSAYQNIGFSATPGFDASPWVAIGETSVADGNLYARASDNSLVSLGSNLLGAPHLFKITWNAPANNFSFYVDGNLAATTGVAITVNTPMYVQVSNFLSNSAGLSVDWLRATPYASSGSFVSRVFDHVSYAQWGAISWTASTPPGTSITMLGRVGNTIIPDSTWSGFKVLTRDSAVGLTGRYIQYKANLTTNNIFVTPVLQSVAIACTDGSGPLVISRQPASQVVCSGSGVMFISEANGTPAPTVQWQSSNDGVVWTNIGGAIKDTLLIASPSGTAGQYRAVWTNTSGSINSNTATYTINSLPSAKIAGTNSVLCQGNSVQLKLTAATGKAPYSLVVNGKSYPGITVGQVFATLPLPESTIWPGTAFPSGSPNANDGQPIETGVKFRSSVSGLIKGIRFYKGAGNNGTHTGSFWTTDGTQLATATFTGETASGWQEVRFTSPVFIMSGTTYIASCYSPGGGYAFDGGYFLNSGYNNAPSPLTALQSGGSANPNGVFKYGGGFPNTGNNANYWVDVIFEATQSAQQTYVYRLTSVTDSTGCTNTGATIDSAKITVNPLPSGSITAPAVACYGNPINLTFNAASGKGPYSLTINGKVFNNINNGVPFISGDTALPVVSTIWPSSSVGGSQTADTAAVELGINFTSSSPGNITGVRFYKTDAGVFTYRGSLWNQASPSTPLAAASYTSDAGTGWRQIVFATPIAINANTTYTASYFSPSGNHYAFTANGLNTPVVNAPLAAQSSVFKVGGGFPNSASTANYWVDVSFNSGAGNTYNLTAITDSNGCTTSAKSLGTTSVTVTQVNASVSAQTNVQCYGKSTGSVTIAASGGTAPYSYSITGPTVNTTGASNGIFTGLSAGNYTATVKEANGCSKNIPFNITSPTAVTGTIVKQDVTCFGLSNGSFTVTAAGGVSPYTYSLDSGANYQNTATRNNLAAQNYLVMIKDSVQCISNISVPILQPAKLADSLIAVNNNACHGGTSGSISVTGTGGTRPYTYTIAGPTVNTTGKTTGIFTGLAAGNYTITVSDSNNCSPASITTTITEPATTTPDIALGAIVTDNLFTASNTQNTIVYNISELKGNPAAGDTLKITRVSGYSFKFDNALTTITVNGTQYQLDNSRWSVDNSDPLYYIVILNRDPLNNNIISCGQRVRLAVTIVRNTSISSTININSQMQRVNGELLTDLANNYNSILFIAQ